VDFSYAADRPVLRSASLELGAGMTLVLGPNGCGKSTLLKLAAGVEVPRAGRAEVDGHDMWRDEVEARRGLAYVPEHPDLTPYATVAEILTLVCGLRREPPDAGEAALQWVGLDRLGHRTVRELSRGERRRAVLAAARIGRPTHLILDEPLDAVDRGFREELLGWMGERRAAGAVLLVVSHDLADLAPLADRALTVRDGRCHELPVLPTGAERLPALERLARGSFRLHDAARTL
jgi:ABC-type multidrug transport system ATPase subunit